MNLSGTGGTGLALSSQARSKSEGPGACSRVIGSGISMKSLDSCNEFLCKKSCNQSLYAWRPVAQVFLSVAFDKSHLFKSQFAAAVANQLIQINAIMDAMRSGDFAYGVSGASR